jgi:hypothetical protein
VTKTIVILESKRNGVWGVGACPSLGGLALRVRYRAKEQVVLRNLSSGLRHLWRRKIGLFRLSGGCIELPFFTPRFEV